MSVEPPHLPDVGEKSKIPSRDGRGPMGLDAPSRNDPWSIWFWRIVQIIGLIVFLEQVIVSGSTTRPDRPWILIFAMAMMLGGYGMVTLIRAVVRLGGE